MYEVDVPKFEGKIVEKGFTKKSFAEDVLKVSRETLRNYMKRPETIPYEVLSKAAQVLCDSPEEVLLIFFVHKLTQNARI